MSDSHGSNTPTILMVIIGIIVIGALIGIFYPKTTTRIKKILPAIEKLGKINGSPVNPNDNRGTDAYYTPANIDSPVCGIKIFSPLPGQTVSFPLEVAGYVNGCNWVPFESQVGTIEMRDANQALSKLIIIPVDGDTYTLPAYFKIKIAPSLAPTSNNGVLIFHNEDPSGLKSETFQIPIIF